MHRLFMMAGAILLTMSSVASVEASPSFTFDAPKGWVQEKPRSTMRKAQFRLPGKSQQKDAELAIFSFPGGGGSIEANLHRWYGQFENENGKKRTSPDKKETLKTKEGLSVTWVRINGTYLKSRSPMMRGPVDKIPNQGMLGAIVEATPNPYFIKATGPRGTIEKWQKEFTTFVTSFRVNHKR